MRTWRRDIQSYAFDVRTRQKLFLTCQLQTISEKDTLAQNEIIYSNQCPDFFNSELPSCFNCMTMVESSTNGKSEESIGTFMVNYCVGLVGESFQIAWYKINFTAIQPLIIV